MRWRLRERHEDPPTRAEEAGEHEEAARAAASRILNSDYWPAVEWLGNELRGKVVAGSIGGHAGYILWFDDGDWVAVWLDPHRAEMRFSVGDGDSPATVRSFLSNPEVANASGPVDVDRIYAKESNDIAAEARETHGKPVEGVAIGARAFSLCFPDGMELEGSVFEDSAGRPMIRVFWEQW